MSAPLSKENHRLVVVSTTTPALLVVVQVGCIRSTFNTARAVDSKTASQRSQNLKMEERSSSRGARLDHYILLEEIDTVLVLRSKHMICLGTSMPVPLARPGPYFRISRLQLSARNLLPALASWLDRRQRIRSKSVLRWRKEKTTPSRARGIRRDLRGSSA